MPDVFVTLKATISDFQAKMAQARADMDRTARSSDQSATQMGNSGSQGLSLIAKSALAIAPALAPVGTVVAGLGVGLVGIAGAAGAGLGALALAAKPVISSMNTASNAQLAYSQAVANFGKNSSQAHTALANLHNAYSQMTPAEIAATGGLTNFKNAFQTWTQSFDPQILPLFSQGLGMAQKALGDISPLVVGAASGLRVFLQAFQPLLGATHLFNQLGAAVGSVIGRLGPVIANIVTAILKIVIAAQPLASVVLGLLGQLASALAGLNFAGILAPLLAAFQRLAPIVGQFAESLIVLLGGALRALAPIGVAAFQVISAGVTAIMPAMAAIGRVIGAIAPIVAQVASALAGVLGSALKGLAPIIIGILPLVTDFVRLIGTGLINIFREVGPAINEALPVVAQLVDALASALGPAIAGLAPLISDLSPLTFVFTPVAEQIGRLAPLFGQLAGVVASLIPPVGQIVGSFLSAGGALMGQLVPALVTLARTVLAALLPVLQKLVPILPQIAQLMSKALLSAIQALIPVIVELSPVMAKLIPLLGNFLVGALKVAVDMLKHVPGPILAIAAALLIFDVNPVVLGLVALAAGAAYLATHWSKVWGDIKNVIHDAETWIRQHIVLISTILGGPVGLAISYLATHWSQVWNGMQSAVSTFVNFFTAIPGEIWNGVVYPILKFFADAPGEILGYFSHLGSDLLHTIEKAIPGGGLVGKAFHAIGLAEGGLVTSPTLAVVGESGPELVIPLSALKGAALEGAGINRGVGVAAGGTAGATGGGGDLVIQINGQEFARVAGPYIRNWFEQGPGRNSRVARLSN